MTIRPKGMMRERIPKYVRSGPHQNRSDNKRKPPRPPKSKPVRTRAKPALDRLRQQSLDRPPHISVEDPKNDKTNRQIQDKNTQQCVSEMSSRYQANKVFKIGPKSAHHQRRGYQTCSAKGQCSCGVRKSEGHCFHYSLATASHSENSCVRLQRAVSLLVRFLEHRSRHMAAGSRRQSRWMQPHQARSSAG